MVDHFNGGNLAFASMVVVAFICEGIVFYLARSYNEWNAWRWFVGGVLIFFAALGIWAMSQTGKPLCFPNLWLQGHAVWHAMTAVTVAMLYRYFALAPDRPRSYTYLGYTAVAVHGSF